MREGRAESCRAVARAHSRNTLPEETRVGVASCTVDSRPPLEHNQEPVAIKPLCSTSGSGGTGNTGEFDAISVEGSKNLRTFARDGGT